MSIDVSLQVWIVDDDPDDTSFYVAALKDLGYQGIYMCFNDAETALEQLERPNLPLPTLLIIDYSMPKMSGIEMVECLRKSGLLDKIEVVLFSGNVNHPLREYAAFAGINVHQKSNSYRSLMELFSVLSLIQKEE